MSLRLGQVEVGAVGGESFLVGGGFGAVVGLRGSLSLLVVVLSCLGFSCKGWVSLGEGEGGG